MKTKALIFFILVVGAGVYFLFPRLTQAPFAEEGPIITNIPQVSETLFEEEGDNYIISISVPKIQENAAFLELRNDIQIRIESFKELAREYEGPVSAPWALNIEVEQINSDHVSSYLVNLYEYTGGAHGNVMITSYNYSLATGEGMNVLDIVSTQDSLYTLATLANQELSVSYPEGLSGSDPSNWNTWYAEDDSVTFIFSPYQIAPYSVGIQEFTVTRSEGNEGVFNQEYFK